jgi:hypothetical protein
VRTIRPLIRGQILPMEVFGVQLHHEFSIAEHVNLCANLKTMFKVGSMMQVADDDLS